MAIWNRNQVAIFLMRCALENCRRVNARSVLKVTKDDNEREVCGLLSWIGITAVLAFLQRPSHPVAEGCGEPQGEQERCRLRLRLSEDEVLFVHDYGQDGGSLRLRA